MPRRFPDRARAAALLLSSLAVAGLAAPAAAQSVNDFRLPAGRPAPSPAPAGPRADEAPAPRPAATRDEGGAAPDAARTPPSTLPAREAAPGPAPRIVLPGTDRPPADAPPPRLTRPGARRAGAAGPTPFPSPSPPAAEPLPGAADPPPLPTPTPAGTISAPPPLAGPATAPASAGWIIPGGALALVGAGTALLVRRRRSRHAPPAEAATPSDPPADASSRPPRPGAPASAALEIGLDAVRMSVSLINATLRYRLTVTNTGEAPASGIAARLDMIAAHVGQGDREQVEAGPGAGAAVHGIEGLAPGGSVSWTGDLRLRLVDIPTIRQGASLLFVPLVRVAADHAGHHVVPQRVKAFVVGEPLAPSGGRLAPIRLELGPRILPDLAARRVDSAT